MQKGNHDRILDWTIAGLSIDVEEATQIPPGSYLMRDVRKSFKGVTERMCADNRRVTREFIKGREGMEGAVEER